MILSSANIDPAEITKFSTMADLWWDRKGPFKALHDINPVRLRYLRQRAGLAGKQVLDVGCGGGLLTEALAAEGALVTGIDMAAAATAVARRHAARSGLQIDYHQSTAEAWAQDHAAAYDSVTCMELLEHVPDPAGLVQACGALVRGGGDLFFATVNRTWLARLLVIWMSEYVLGIVRKGTHTYARLVRPTQLQHWAQQTGLVRQDLTGLRYVPYIGHAGLCKSTQMNYMMHFKKP